MLRATEYVVVKGAREHNLKGVDLSFPRDSLTTFTGVSGSGKSSLAMHTIYQEGQRRFLESLSAYARQFVGRMEKPKVDRIEGLSPTVAIDQKTTSHSVRSTVGTLTEVADFLRLLWSRLGEPSCPECGAKIEAWTSDKVVDAILKDHAGQQAMVLAPVVRERKGEYRKELEEWRGRGFVRARIDGEVQRLDQEVKLHRYKYHTIELVIDRLVIEDASRSRLTEAVEQCTGLAEGLCGLLYGENEYRLFSMARSCPNGHGSLPEMEPRLFSFNSPLGACPHCDGLGEVHGFREDLLIADPELSLEEGALHGFTPEGRLVYSRLSMDHLAEVGKAFGFDVKTPWKKLKEAHRRIVLHGTGERTFDFKWKKGGAVFQTSGRDRIAFPGVLRHLQQAFRPSRARHLDRYRAATPCPECNGARLSAAARAVTFQGRSLPEVMGLPVTDALLWAQETKFSGNAQVIGEPVLREVERRLSFLAQVGLGYVTLSRRAHTLSGGESQRIRLAAQVGAGLRGILYVLDEPSIGLHARDQDRLLHTLQALRDRGNTVVVVEHDQETMERSDFLVDVGPGAGSQGGEVVVAGVPDAVRECKRSLTGGYLRGELSIPRPAERRQKDAGWIELKGAKHHNLKDIDVSLPLGCFVAVTGVSGSGKSTLVHHVLKPGLQRMLMKDHSAPLRCKSLKGLGKVDKLVEIDQAPIGRTPRSNAATYTGVWDHVRDLFAMLPEARLREYKKGRFSFNVEGGRCEACGGAGVQTLEMNFLAPVEVVCEECQGSRFHAETLEIRFKDQNVHDVLEMTIDQAAELFAGLPKIARGLNTLQDVGLGYLHLGQPSTTLSGGEAQRVKLATELQRPATGSTLYVLDEPTTGLHFDDVRRLLECLQALVDAGNTVLVIEHNLDVVKCADWVVDLGPEGGDGGGTVVIAGTPEEVAACAASHTGVALRPVLGMKAGKTKAQKDRLVPVRQTAPTHITVRGARMHNLQGVDADVPLGKFTVITGPSGSGKSSLAFDTLFREGQRRFLESMSTYARRFLGRMDRAPVDVLEGLGPAIAIDQKQSSRSPRSTVATATEIADYLRLLWARAGRPHCPRHGQELVAWSPSKIAAELSSRWKGKRGYVMAPVPVPETLGKSGKKAAHWQDELREGWKKAGFVRALRDGAELRLDEEWPASAPKELLLVIDRVGFDDRGRLADAAEQAAKASAEHGPALVVAQLAEGERLLFSSAKVCPHCGFSVPDQPHPRFFSFNHHSGACASCAGLGEVVVCDTALLVNHPGKPVFGGGIQHQGAAFTFLCKKGGYYHSVAEQMAEAHGFDLDQPWQKLSAEAQRLLLRGSGEERYEVEFRKYTAGKSRTWRMAVSWKGIGRQIEEWFHGREGEGSGDDKFRAVMTSQRCPDCEGERLQLGQRHVRVGGRRLPEILAMTVEAAIGALRALTLDANDRQIGADALREIDNRLGFLRDVGLGYLGLDRSAATLSGGEAQRIRLATQLGNQLVGVLYVLDEPTVGLHPRDTERLLATLRGLRDLGNTVLAVEHDAQVIRAADHVFDMGPGAGHHGGRIVASGTPAAVEAGEGLTGRWLRGELRVPASAERRTGTGTIKLADVNVHNLRGLDVELPLGVLTAVTGVSGSGKSSLVLNALVPALESGKAKVRWHDGKQPFRVVVVDQGTLGTTPASNPATYTGVFGPIRDLFAHTQQARAKGFKPGRFSFNVAEGRCANCEGKGQIQVEMHFLADVWVTCEVCKGRRYNSETLTVDYRGRNIAQVLAMEVDEALAFFQNHKQVARPLQLLHDVGLGYLRLGQSATTFSGGEAQRIKLVAQLATSSREHTIYVMDEPTTGLHMDDVGKLLGVVQRFLERGDTVIVIEHNLDVIRTADHVLELGPEAGAGGGRITAQGTPEEVAKASTHTGRFLSGTLAKPVRKPARARTRQEAS